MKIIDYIKNLLFPEVVDEDDTLKPYRDDVEGQESYYVPPLEDQYQEQDNSKYSYIDVIKEEKQPSIQTDGYSMIKRLQNDIVTTIEEFDSYINRIENDDTKELISLFQLRLIDSLANSGLDKIDEETNYSCLRHTPVPFQVIPEGSSISEIKRAGLARDGQIVLKALVVIKDILP